MFLDITKTCADALRDHALDSYGIKLKASHAHEIVALLFNYKSRAALLADTDYPITKLNDAMFIVHDPSPCNTGYVEQRLKDFGYDLLNSFQLADCFRAVFQSDKELAGKIHVNFREVSIHVAEQYLHQTLKTLGIAPASIDWQIEGDLYNWGPNGDANLTADVTYRSDAGEPLRYTSYSIHLPRLSANLGYGPPKVVETFYAGRARKLDFSAA